MPSSEPLYEQPTLETWRCPTCLGARTMLGPSGLVRCRVCGGTGRVDYDPDDRTEIPY